MHVGVYEFEPSGKLDVDIIIHKKVGSPKVMGTHFSGFLQSRRTDPLSKANIVIDKTANLSTR